MLWRKLKGSENHLKPHTWVSWCLSVFVNLKSIQWALIFLFITLFAFLSFCVLHTAPSFYSIFALKMLLLLWHFSSKAYVQWHWHQITSVPIISIFFLSCTIWLLTSLVLGLVDFRWMHCTVIFDSLSPGKTSKVRCCNEYLGFCSSLYLQIAWKSITLQDIKRC